MIRSILLIALSFATSAFAQIDMYYYQGRQKVDVKVRTDVLAVSTTGSLDAVQTALQRLLPAGKVVPSVDESGLRISTDSPSSLTGLTDAVRKIRSVTPQAEIAVIFNRVDGRGEQDQVLTGEISFRIKPGQSVASLAQAYGMEAIQSVSYAKDTFTAKVRQDDNPLKGFLVSNELQEKNIVEWASPLILRRHVLRHTPNDPLYGNQWHLKNTGANTTPAVAGVDLNVESAWDTVTGSGINIAVTDDGLETSHPDLMANVRWDLDYDFNGNDSDPNPTFTSQSHGTACAGVAAGVGDNSLGVSGVAPGASLVGLRLIAANTTDAQDATALSWNSSETDPANMIYINSNSWGPTDNGVLLSGIGPLTEAALENGVTQGRGGKGTIYTWACGNGRASSDNVNRDGWANSPNVIAVAASNASGVVSSYSEAGSAVLVNAPSSSSGGSPNGITTTDLTGGSGASLNDYRNNFGGTSSAAPAVAGVIALILEINPAVTYRDVMHILVESAVQNDPGSSSWFTNGAGRKFSHDYGFGRVNAGGAVALAQTWLNIPTLVKLPEISNSFPSSISIPDNNLTGVTFDIPVVTTGTFSIEHVELEADVTHSRRGQLSIQLISPAGTVSNLLPSNTSDTNANISHWRMRTVANWGEDATGTWKVRIADIESLYTGSINSLTLRIQGYEAPASNVKNWAIY